MTELPSSRRAFLNVTCSAAGRPWQARLNATGEATALAIAQRHGLPDLLARVLAGRGVGLDEVEDHLDPSLRNLMPDPDTVTDMAAAAARLAAACRRGETVAVFGDYDVDGAASAALLTLFLRAAGLYPLVHIPDRLFEGYGPNAEAIRRLAARGVTLLVTVDCGTTSLEPLEEARKLGLDVVVIDHHQVAGALPPAAAIVNPNRDDDLSGLGHLAAVGLVFLTVIATARVLRQSGFWSAARPEPDLIGLVDLVALGTVADVVPLKGLNRAYVAKGLLAMRRRSRPGLVALMDVARLEGPPKPWHLGFLLGPRINAGGRIGDAGLGARLLATADDIEARRIAAELDRLNAERQAIEQATVAEAEAEALAAMGLKEGPPVAVVAAERWHPGVMGLVAARLKEKLGRPAIAIAWGANGQGTGSGRSISGVDLGKAVRAAVEAGIAVKGGGHAMAAGLTIAREQLGALRAFLEERLAGEVAAARARDALLIDGALTAGGAGPELVASIERGGPFGAGNPEPVFALPAHTVAHAETFGADHLRARLRAPDGATVDAVAFRVANEPVGRLLLAARGQSLHVAGTLSLDRWQARERVQLKILDAAEPVR
ncbi:single-stranded-DNA-specific exonuclease RecJ [Blastochloris tepida]|uniref:Single-stranded-DNA-specific exonuclease RecJ n=1 Tax=Blastochloris tepida TaxID=2233851 RepID=A0A348G118_9HYPH|nr:single-stranded-DNA-specific exonuclease RecJ [Blastochloris tepida]BBF93251.1 single-stranded-DNA-specific exonuclease [Blastochloris tepida]